MWFVEDPWPPLVLFALIGLVFAFTWMSTRRPGHLLIAAVGFVLAGLSWGVDQLVVTDAERMEMRVVSLCEDFRDRSPKLLDYFSKDTPELRNMATAAQALVEVQPDMVVTDRVVTVNPTRTSATTRFRVNATMNVNGIGSVGRQPAMFELTWKNESPEWRIVKVRRLNPLSGKDMGVLDRNAG